MSHDSRFLNNNEESNQTEMNKESSTESSNDIRSNQNHHGRNRIQKTDDSTDKIEQRIRDLILMAGGKGPKRWKQRKKEYLKKIENDNAELKNIIIDLQQKINAYQSQKNIILDQLRYFQGCLDQAAPFILQQSESDNNVG